MFKLATPLFTFLTAFIGFSSHSFGEDPLFDEGRTLIATGKLDEAPEGMYYIKIPRDAASQNKAQVIFNDMYGIDYEINDDPDGIVMYFKKR